MVSFDSLAQGLVFFGPPAIVFGLVVYGVAVMTRRVMKKRSRKGRA